MARARNIKPGFFQNPELGELDPLERLCFIGMWTIADYKGCIEFKAKRMKVQILPYDECCIEKIVINLERSGLIETYSVQGQLYVKIKNFVKHQNPHKNERDAGSNIPDVDKDDFSFEEKRTEYRDLGRLRINRDKARLNRDKDGTAPADSLLLIPESPILNPDCGLPESRQVAQQDKPAKKLKAAKAELDYSVWPQQPDQQVFKDWIEMRKAKRATLSQTVLDTFGEEFRLAATFGYSVNDCLRTAIASSWTGFRFSWMQNQNSRGSQHAGNQSANRASGSSGGLAHDDSKWADELFGAEPPAVDRFDQQGVQVLEGNFSRVGSGD